MTGALTLGRAVPAAYLLVVVAYLAGEIAFAGRFGPPLDDGWIYLAFARDLADGKGVTYPGFDGPVAACTGPVWCMLLALLLKCGLPGVLASKLLGITVGALAVLGVHRLARTVLQDPQRAAVVAILFALTPREMWGNLSGMEVPFYVATVSFGLALHIERRREGLSRWLLAAVVLWLAGWARPECFVFVCAAALDRWRWRSMLVVGGLLALYPAFHIWAHGHPLPTTFYAKAASAAPWAIAKNEGIGVALTTAATNVGLQVSSFLGYLGAYLPFAVLGFAAGVRRAFQQRSPLRAVLAALLLFAVARGTLGFAVPWFQQGRYFGHMWPLFLIVCVAGWNLGKASHVLGGLTFSAVVAGFVAKDDLAAHLAFDWLLRDIETDVDTAANALIWTPAAGALVLAIIGLVAFWRSGQVPRPPLWCLAAWLGVALFAGAARHGQGVRDTYELNVQMAEKIAELSDPDDLIACHDIGALGWFSDREMLDLAGLGSPDVVFSELRREDGHWDTAAILSARKPRWLVLTDHMATMVNPLGQAPGGLLGAAKRFEITFEPNVTVQGDVYTLIELTWQE